MANKKITNELGYSGTIIRDGIISDPEHNSDLKGLKWLKTVDQMRKGDGTVRALIQAIFLPILSAHWYVEAASEDKLDKDVSKFVEDNLMDGMTRTWTEFLREALLHLLYGVMPFEEIYELKDDGMIKLRKLGVRMPQTIYKWKMEDGGDGITQMISTGEKASIPIEKMTIFVNEKEGDNWNGNSLLRPVYKHWYFKEAIYKIDAMAHEKHGLGVPIITLPPNATAADEAKAKEIAMNIRVHNQAFISMTAGWVIEMLDQKSSAIKNPSWSIQHHNREIVLSGLAQFLEIGSQGSSGSYAASNDQSELFMLAEEYVANHIADTMSNYAIKRLVDFNFTVTEYPKLKCNKIRKIDFQKLSQALQSLATAQFLTPNAKTEDWVRDMYDMPEIEDTDRAEEELMAYIKEAENKQVNVPVAVPMTTVQQQTPDQMTANEMIEGATPSQPQTNQTNQSNQPQPPMNDVIQKNINKKLELQQLINEKKLWVLEQQKRGAKITPKQSAQIKIDIVELQAKLDKQEMKDNQAAKKILDQQSTNTDKTKPVAPVPPVKKANDVAEMKRRVDNAITAIEKQISD